MDGYCGNVEMASRHDLGLRRLPATAILPKGTRELWLDVPSYQGVTYGVLAAPDLERAQLVLDCFTPQAMIYGRVPSEHEQRCAGVPAPLASLETEVDDCPVQCCGC